MTLMKKASLYILTVLRDINQIEIPITINLIVKH